MGTFQLGGGGGGLSQESANIPRPKYGSNLVWFNLMIIPDLNQVILDLSCVQNIDPTPLLADFCARFYAFSSIFKDKKLYIKYKKV